MPIHKTVPSIGEALDEHLNTLLSLGTNRRRVPPRVSANCPVISLSDTPEVSIKPTVIQTPREPATKEPKFTCPICLNELTEASSTKCGSTFSARRASKPPFGLRRSARRAGRSSTATTCTGCTYQGWSENHSVSFASSCTTPDYLPVGPVALG